MRTVFRFAKCGAARYISHLDLIRTMNRAIRRAGIPAQYSQGFHPHIVMSFAQALGLGYLSHGEYMEISLDGAFAPCDAVDALNNVLPDGLLMTGAWPLDDSFPTLMASVSAARWLVEFSVPVDSFIQEKFASLLVRESVEVLKDGRNGPVNAEIRRGIYSIDCMEGAIELFLAAGSTLNIRPELVVKAALGGEEKVAAIRRLELYTCVNERHMPLSKICIGGEQYERGKNDIG